jgi:hypothetical protein
MRLARATYPSIAASRPTMSAWPREAEPIPFYVSLWLSRSEGQKPIGRLRAIRDDHDLQRYRIQRYQAPSVDWKDVSSIGTRYRVAEGELREARN